MSFSIKGRIADNPVLQKIGMNLDDAINGILLRTPDAELSAMSRHRGYQSVYNDVVRNQLNKLNVNQSVEVHQRQVFDLQSDLRKLQESGLPLYPSQGAIVDFLERILNNQFRVNHIKFTPALTKVQIFKLKKNNPNIAKVFIEEIDGDVVEIPNIDISSNVKCRNTRG